MTRTENNCVGCATENYPCVGDNCPYRNVEHYYCDKCGSEAPIHNFDDEELCKDCIMERLAEEE